MAPVQRLLVPRLGCFAFRNCRHFHLNPVDGIIFASAKSFSRFNFSSSHTSPHSNFHTTAVRTSQNNESSDSETMHKKCKHCDNLVGLYNVKCNICGKLVPNPSDTTYYQLFEKPVTFDFAPRTLRPQFLKMQQQVHPDNYANKSSEQRDLADSHSAFINKAYSTLTDPLRRAEYILHTYFGIDPNPEHVIRPTDPELLMEVMQAMEEIEEASDETDLAQLKKDMDKKFEESEKNMTSLLDSAFKQGELLNTDLRDQLFEEAVKMRYIGNIRYAKFWGETKI